MWIWLQVRQGKKGVFPKGQKRRGRQLCFMQVKNLTLENHLNPEDSTDESPETRWR
jgi:hypothetical protein